MNLYSLNKEANWVWSVSEVQQTHLWIVLVDIVGYLLRQFSFTCVLNITTHTVTHVHTHTQSLTPSLTHTHSPVHTYTHTHIHTHSLTHTPIPDDPRKRNTRGWSSSAQPNSLLRIAERPAMQQHTLNQLNQLKTK